MSSFSKEERKQYRLRKHVREHLFEYTLDVIVPVLVTACLLYVCRAERLCLGIMIVFAYSLSQVLYRIHYYKTDVLDIDIR